MNRPLRDYDHEDFIDSCLMGLAAGIILLVMLFGAKGCHLVQEAWQMKDKPVPLFPKELK